MVNKVTFRVILRKEKKTKAGYPVAIQCFVNGARVVIPLSIKVEQKYFDKAREIIKSSHPDHGAFNEIISNARSRAWRILAEANTKDYRLDRESFRSQFTLTVSDYDFVTFWEKEIESRKPLLERGTYNQHVSALRKFKRFRKSMPFDKIDSLLPEDYERFLRKEGNNINTIACAHKNVKTYIKLAIKRGINIINPYNDYKVKKGSGRIIHLTLLEQKMLLEKYATGQLPETLRISVLVFLCQSFTSLRISDIKAIVPSWVQNGELRFTPYKNRRSQKLVSFGLSKIGLDLLQQLFDYKRNGTIKSEQKINQDIKMAAALCGISKRITTHTARHTFATTFLTIGGQVDVLQQIMGHSSISTTIRYVHIIDERKTQQMGNFDTEFNQYANT